ncbi:LysR family transcriptional regulator [Sorangium sp. So ce381]
MIQDDLAGLSVLLVVAEKRSFTRAAAELRVTPSAVSQTITGLERRLGVRLLQRTTRSVGLTEAGARFLERLRFHGKRLARLLEGFCPPFPGYFLYYPSRAHVPPKLSVFIDFLRRRGSRRRRGG